MLTWDISVILVCVLTDCIAILARRNGYDNFVTRDRFFLSSH